MSQTICPRQLMRRRGSAVTWRRSAASRFSAAAAARKRCLVALGDDDGHALLALGYGELRAVEAGVLALDAVEVYLQAVGELAYGDGDAARAEVVAALYHARDLAVAEEALELALDGGVALLHLRAAVGEAVAVVGLARARRAAHAVAARAAAEQYDDVARLGALAHDVFSGAAATTAPISRRLAT